jgi:hypothetical protein
MRDKQLEEAILALNKKKLEEYLDKLSGSKEDSDNVEREKEREK